MTTKPIENSSEKLNPALYMKWDRQFMAYGSIMNSLQNVMTEANWVEIATKAWELSETVVGDLVEKLYAENELPVIKEGDEIPL